ncbi:MAG: isochorismatase family cysteine hydrolase [Pseudomonadota bacterium]
MHKVDLPEHILERARILRGRDTVFEAIDPARTAHVVVDLQNGFMRPGAPVEVPVAREIVGQVNRISGALRAAGGLVVYLRYTSDPDEPQDWSAWYKGILSPERAEEQRLAFAPGAIDHALYPDLDVAETDLIVDKTRFSGFVPGTCDLHEILQARNIDTLIITGTLTNCCCESTARDANQRNYKVIFVTDGNATHTDAEHNATLCNMGTIFADLQSTDQVCATIAGSARDAAA